MQLIDRRIGLLFAIFLLLLVAAAGRAAWLGTVRADDLRSRAAKQQVEDLDVPARRGTITDRHGTELAVSENATTVFAHPFLLDDPAAAAARLAPILRVRREELLDKLSDRDRGFVYLKRKLDGKAGERVKGLEIEGIDTVVEPRRRYPQGSLAAQVLGTVGIDNEGLAGLEQAHEQDLHGRDGDRRLVKDALGKPIRIADTRPAEAGEDLELTIDTAIQERTEAVLAEIGATYKPKGASAIVMDPRNGEILALANWPRVNANDISGAPAYARQNRAIAASYEPGSTFKPMTVAGSLSERLVRPNTTLSLPPTLQVADRTIEEAHPRGAVTLTVGQVLAQSSNVGTVKIGLQLGAQRFDRWVRRFGFGAMTGIDLPGEASGIMLRPSDYSGSSMGNMPIGQGIAVTQVQMAAAYAAIANGGVAVRPHIVRGAPAPKRRVLSRRVAGQVSHMLEGVFGQNGTASEAAVKGYQLAGKTGTAEKANPNGGYYENKYFASFIGYAPARRPRLLVAVSVDEPQGAYYGGVVAAPAFEKIVSFALPYLRIPPR